MYVTEEAVGAAKALGLNPLGLVDMVRRSVPLTSQRFNRRYRAYVFMCQDDTVSAVGEYASLRGTCQACGGLGCQHCSGHGSYANGNEIQRHG